jgi:hypothetical protein
MARRETSGWAFRVLNAPKTDLQLPNETLLRLSLHLVGEEVRVNEGDTIALCRSASRHAYAVKIFLCMRPGRKGQRQSELDNT